MGLIYPSPTGRTPAPIYFEAHAQLRNSSRTMRDPEKVGYTSFLPPNIKTMSGGIAVERRVALKVTRASPPNRASGVFSSPSTPPHTYQLMPLAYLPTYPFTIVQVGVDDLTNLIPVRVSLCEWMTLSLCQCMTYLTLSLSG
jgi:hypothetical protein